MKRLIPVSVLIMIILLIIYPSFADFQKGLDAYKIGDYTTVVKEWAPTAEQDGRTLMQYDLGVIFYNGLGSVPVNYATAAKWFTLATKSGDFKSQYFMGLMHQNGQGFPANSEIAIKWYTKSAKQGFAAAQINLGMMYYNGIGIPKDHLRAYMWWNIFGSQGNAEARKNREIVEKNLSSTQLETAQMLAKECVKKNYKDC
jgi:uncharacterized protein